MARKLTKADEKRAIAEANQIVLESRKANPPLSETEIVSEAEAILRATNV